MKLRKKRKDLRALCAEVHADDGVNPREASTHRWRRDRATQGGGPDGFEDPADADEARLDSRRGRDRKDLQLAKQVFHAVEAALRGELRDPVLQDARVASVQPAPDASRMLVVLELSTLAGRVKPEVLLERIERVRGFLRCEVAASITRKRSPELSFQVIRRPGGHP